MNKVADRIGSGNSVMAKELDLDTNGLAAMVKEELEGGKYDLCMVISSDPIRMGMLLNKASGISAAVCSSGDDVTTAKGDDANVIIVKDADSDDLDGLVSAAYGKGWGRGIDISAGIKKIGGAIKKDDAPQKEPQSKLQTKKQAAKEDEKKAEEEEPPPNNKNMSTIERIKESLGIV